MKSNLVCFEIKGRDVYIHGYPPLEGRKGFLAGNGIAFFYGEGWRNYELYLANTQTGKIRQFATVGGLLLVDSHEIDYAAIERNCPCGVNNARNKEIRYAALSRWDGFEEGLYAISWMLYPEGRYFADSDGFGMEDNEEENVYAIINTNLDIIEPFRPIENISNYLQQIRKHFKKEL